MGHIMPWYNIYHRRTHVFSRMDMATLNELFEMVTPIIKLREEIP